MKVDILAFASHPDDVELSCSGTLIAHIEKGYKVAIVDLTQGELGTRGTPAIRADESAAASQIMGIHARENLNFRDGFFKNDERHQMEVVRMIRKYRPRLVLANAISDRHPDHGRGAEVVRDAFFLSGLRMIETSDNGENQEAYRPVNLYHYIQNNYIQPDFVVDISDYWDQKEQAIRAFKSQFFDPNSTEPGTFISSPEFLNFIKARAQEFGHAIHTRYGEGFTTSRMIGTQDLFHLV
jgi:bacillithiol biosynthesis deacetylase BshB1